MKLKRVLVAFAVTSSIGFHSLAGAEDGLSKAIRDEVRSKQLQRELAKLTKAAADFDRDQSQEALTNFKGRLERTVQLLTKTGVALDALSEALDGATGKSEVGAKSFAFASPNLAPAQPSPSPTAVAVAPKPKQPSYGGGM